MSGEDKLRNAFSKFFRSAADHISEITQEVSRTVEKMRDGSDSGAEEQTKLFQALGEKTYKLYKDGKEQFPEILKESIKKIDEIRGKVMNDERFEELTGKVADSAKEVMDEIDGIVDNVLKRVAKPKAETAAKSAAKPAKAKKTADAKAEVNVVIEPVKPAVKEAPVVKEAPAPAPEKKAARKKAPAPKKLKVKPEAGFEKVAQEVPPPAKKKSKPKKA